MFPLFRKESDMSPKTILTVLKATAAAVTAVAMVLKTTKKRK
jgi:hypothetical protein